MVKINGKEYDNLTGKTVSQMIEALGYNMNFIAVEYNGEILPKIEYQETVLKENDALEVVSFVGGG